MRFVWDPKKDELNRAKHGLSFEESTELFVGPIKRGVIVLAYTEPEDDVLRLLSARMATRNERRRYEAYYEEGRHGR